MQDLRPTGGSDAPEGSGGFWKELGIESGTCDQGAYLSLLAQLAS